MIHAFQRWWICPGTMERSRPGPLFAIEEYREEIEDSIRRHDVTVVCAPTSTGKTQKVPEYLLSWATDNGRAGKVFVTTPNRVAAQKASEFFNARFHAADSAAAVLARPRASFVLSGAGDASGDVVYATTGWLRAWLYPQATEMLRTKSWPLAALMVDECHTPDESRTMLLDLALMLLRGGVPVRLVVSSATANLGRLDASLTPGEGTPPARAPGWGLVRLQPPTFPVEVLYRPGAGVLDCVEECVSSLPVDAAVWCSCRARGTSNGRSSWRPSGPLCASGACCCRCTATCRKKTSGWPRATARWTPSTSSWSSPRT